MTNNCTTLQARSLVRKLHIKHFIVKVSFEILSRTNDLLVEFYIKGHSYSNINNFLLEKKSKLQINDTFISQPLASVLNINFLEEPRKLGEDLLCSVRC